MPPRDEVLETKSFGAFEIKNADRGEVTAIVATLNVVDKDGDVILPGAVADGTRVKISGYNHDIIYDEAPPAGIGTVTTKGEHLILDGTFFMETTRGRDAFYTTKGLGPEGEWSIGFPRKAVESAPLTDEWRAKGAKRIITRMPLWEASPVFIGAGVGTQTLAAKAAEEVLETGNPYNLVKRGDEYCVVKQQGGETVKCHASREEAMAHFRALEAAYQQEKAAQEALVAKQARDAAANLEAARLFARGRRFGKR